MLALSPLPNSGAEDREGICDAFLGDDFLENIDFSCIFEGFDVDGDLFPAELQLSEPQRRFSAGGEDQEKISSQEREEKKDELTCATATAAAVKRSHGKKKVKVDWTPDLHRRFVQAVEQLGLDKAVPSRILEIMGIHNLTRHNVASHLQKYRTHRKHLLAREAEAASWSQRRLIYNAKNVKKKENKPWISPSIGFPPPSQFRPLHVWGHPTLDGPPMVHPWPPRPPNYIAYWQPHYQRGAAEGWGPSAVISAPHFMPHPLPVMRFAPPPVAGVPQPIYRPQHWVSPLKTQSNLQPEHAHYPSKESIDAAIGDVLAKPWLPLPLGLKPPSTESVLVELQRQGVSKVPPGHSPEVN
ncbi:hypothetical protein KFK09_028801 [Dendrobium nobile]|uniref:HTH myb-type domain-containing protein n=1 Tax=Dendrobium nobile TaxID=94219 RepID=A0A8T3A498_DENNO|nr:hypothetical protein KFK09_028801 [Dendrobium nobile]